VTATKENGEQMSDSVQMPALGESVTEGTVTRWLKQVGERVEVDEPLLEVSTDKVDTEIPSPVAGVVEEILVGEDETVEVGATLATIGDGTSAGSADGHGEQAQEQGDQPAQEPPPEPAESQVSEQTPSADVEEPAPAPAAPSSGGSGDGERVQMPALGESVTEGTVTRWLKKEGDSVEVDEPLLEVSTDKVDTEIPSPVAGVVTSILVGEDETVAVGADLVVIGGSGGSAGEAAEQTPAPQAAEPRQEPRQASDETPSQEAAPPAQTPEPTPARPPAPEASTAQAPPPAAAPGEPRDGSVPSPADLSVYVTPLVRRMATEQGVDLSSITGTGVGGRIRKQDVLDAAAKAKAGAKEPAAASGSTEPSATASLGGTTEKMSRLRRVIAQRMVESLQTSAQLTSVIEVDVTRIARLRAKAKTDFERREGVKLSFMPFFALATIEALKQYPQLNASIEGNSVTYHADAHLGVAVDTDRGLLVPVVHGAGDLNIAGLARKISDLAARTRRNKITPDELGGGTFTLTNTGSRGALFDTPIINQPQVGILGTGAVVKRPIVVTDEDGGEAIAIRSMVYLALTYDHRLVDGADAARFLVSLKERLEEGAFESDLGV
jgi:2-oxoglutarate dehydrogenase E2 component (dihydrolipoamide succinyltransferase)